MYCCRCERCCDPTDLGSYGSAVSCNKCKVTELCFTQFRGAESSRTVLHCIPSCQGPVLPGGKDGAVWVCEKCGAKFSGNSINKVSSFKGVFNNDVGLV